MFENVGGGELLVILVLVLVFFGPNKLPELAKNLGKGIRQFKDAMRGVQDDIKNVTKLDDDTKPRP
jgi:sec-independent protein translocase protein TatA